MTQFEKDLRIFTEYLTLGMISYFKVKYEEDILIIETDDEKFYYDEATGKYMLEDGDGNKTDKMVECKVSEKDGKYVVTKSVSRVIYFTIKLQYCR